MKLAIALGLVYLIAMPIVFRLIAVLHKKLIIDRKAAKAKNNRAALKSLPKPIWPKWRERIAFTMKDKRDFVFKKPKKGSNKEPKSSKITNKQMFFGLWAVGLVVVLLGSFIGMWQLMLLGFIFFFITMGFGINASDSLIKTREKVYDRMFSIARLKLGQSAEYTDNPKAVVTVVEWNDYVKPQKAEFLVPDSFGADGEEGFLRQFNQIFGTETTWVPADDAETHKPGWDYEEGKLTIYAVPPLPTMAPWDEHYVLDPGVAWSFFPVGLAVENGIELPNPKTGETEKVIGFDLSGEAAKIAGKAGYKISPTITTSPMCLAGDTLIGLSDGSNLTIKEIVENNLEPLVLSVTSSKELVDRKMFGAVMTKRSAEILKVTVTGGGYIDSTYEHPFLTHEGLYVNAGDLSVGQKLYSVDNEFLEVESIMKNGRADVYNAEVAGTSNFIVTVGDAEAKKRIVVHNCFIGGGTGGGKSLSVDTLVEVIEKI